MIIGSGRLGTALGIALKRAGYRVLLVASLHSAHARRTAKRIGRNTKDTSIKNLIAHTTNHPECNLIIIAISDDAISTVGRQLAAALRLQTKVARGKAGRRVALHTSGALGAEVLAPLRSAGFAVGSIHPLVSISDSETGADWLSRAYFSVQGDPHASRIARQLVRDLGGKSFRINPKAKALYHAAALMTSPNMTALFDIALEMLTRCGLTKTRARHVLLPLVESTLANLKTQDPSAALTGTFKRGDVATVEKHIESMKAENLLEALAAYKVLAERSLSMVTQPRNESELLRLLSRQSRIE